VRVFRQHGGRAEELRHKKARCIGRANPDKVSVKVRARVTAGLAKEVEAVKQ